MCVKEFKDKLLKISEDIENEYYRYNLELSKVDLYQQDLLHCIENSGFNAVEGYKLAKKLSEIRQKRRKIKIELKNLDKLKGHIAGYSLNKFEYINESASMYHPRVIESIDLKAIINTEVDLNNVKPLYRKTKEKIDVVEKAEKDFYYAILPSGDKCMIHKGDIMIFDEKKFLKEHGVSN